MSDAVISVNPVDPGDKRTITLDYATLLASLPAGAKISASSWELPAELLQVGDDVFSDTTTSVKIDFASARVGHNYTCYNTVETDNGEQRRRAIVIPVRDAGTFNQASTIKETLDAIRAAIAGNATRAQRSRQVGDKRIDWMTPQELIVAETRFQQLYNQEKRNEAIRAGEPFMKTVHTRFVG